MLSEEPGEQQPRLAPGAWLLRLRDLRQQGLVPRDGIPPVVSNPVQAYVGRNPVKKARGIAIVQTGAVFQYAHEDVLAGVARVVFVAEKPATAAQHHRAVA